MTASEADKHVGFRVCSEAYIRAAILDLEASTWKSTIKDTVVVTDYVFEGSRGKSSPCQHDFLRGQGTEARCWTIFKL